MANVNDGGNGNKSKTLIMSLEVTLEELYKGSTRRVEVLRTLECSDCDATGSTRRKTHEIQDICELCRGLGRCVENRVCDLCLGQKTVIHEDYRCTTCFGRKKVTDDVGLVCHVKRGSRPGQKFIFFDEGFQEPNKAAGDLIVNLTFKEPHQRFERLGNDLETTLDITLFEALCGFTRRITTLDNRTLLIEKHRGQVTKYDDCILGEGMPVLNSEDQHGNLIIHYRIGIPKMTTGLAKWLEQCLPPRKELDIPKDAEGLWMI